MVDMHDMKGLYHMLIFLTALIKIHWIDKKISILERRLHIATFHK